MNKTESKQDQRRRRGEAAYRAGLRLRKYIDELAEVGLTLADMERLAEEGLPKRRRSAKS